MTNADIVLKRGLVGYLYRWLRNAGVIATVSGLGFLIAHAYQATHDGRADATVARIDMACVLQGESFLYQAVVIDAECGETDAVRARYKIPLIVKERRMVQLSFSSEIGADYEVSIAADALGRAETHEGDVIPILYERSNPEIVRAVPEVSTYVKSARILFGGLLALALVLLMRWAANWRGDVEAEVAELAQSHRARLRRR